MVVSIEAQAEGDHHLEGEIVASPWSDGRIADETLAELASADAVPEGFTTADLAVLDFDGDARAQANDLSLADARFAPDLLEAAARRAVEAWAEAVDGEDAPLERAATPEAVAQLLYGGDASRRTRLVVRGPRVSRIAIERVDVSTQPATMTVAVEVFGRRYVEDRDTAAVLSGGKDRPQRFSERWRSRSTAHPRRRGGSWTRPRQRRAERESLGLGISIRNAQAHRGAARAQLARAVGNGRNVGEALRHLDSHGSEPDAGVLADALARFLVSRCESHHAGWRVLRRIVVESAEDAPWEKCARRAVPHVAEDLLTLSGAGGRTPLARAQHVAAQRRAEQIAGHIDPAVVLADLGLSPAR